MNLIIPITFWIWLVSAWVNHIITCFQTESWGFLIAGAIAFPVAVIHGTWLWFV